MANAVEGVYAPATIGAHVTLTPTPTARRTLATPASRVTVSLLNANGTPTGKAAVTDASGNVTFSGLTPGSYKVSVAPPAGDSATQKVNVQKPITLASGGMANAVEGVYAPATIGAHVYTDANANGTQDAGDASFAGVTVSLLNANGTPTGKAAVTDASGNVTFQRPDARQLQSVPSRRPQATARRRRSMSRNRSRWRRAAWRTPSRASTPPPPSALMLH